MNSTRMNPGLRVVPLALLCAAVLFVVSTPAVAREPELAEASFRVFRAAEIALPEPAKSGPLSVEETIQRRRSVREFGDEPVTVEQLSQLLWAAQGITGERGFKRAAPSAGAKYPIEIFVAAGEVEGLAPGLYRYAPKTHALTSVRKGDVRAELCDEALSQKWVRDAPLSIIITAVYGRTMGKYGERGIRYVHMEVGAVAENVYLQAESLGLGTTLVGAFVDDGVTRILGTADVAPLGIMPVGVRR